MPELTITNSKGRDAQVLAESVRMPVRVSWLDDDNRQCNSVKFLKGTIDVDYDALLAKIGSPNKVADALIDGDPEINMEIVGSIMRDTSRVYVNSDRTIVHSVTEIEIVRNPDGSEKQRRPKKRAMPNVGQEQPLLWSGKLLAKKDVYKKYVMAAKMQIFHINGLTYDFLYAIAKELESKKSLLLLGAGPKSNQPIILRRGSLPYRGFLEGRTRGEEYMLLLHLSNMELKAPTPAEEPEAKA